MDAGALPSGRGDHPVLAHRPAHIALELQAMAWGHRDPWRAVEAEWFLGKVLRFFSEDRNSRLEPVPTARELNEAFAVALPPARFIGTPPTSCPASMDGLRGDAELVSAMWPAVSWLAYTEAILSDDSVSTDDARFGVWLAWECLCGLLVWLRPPDALRNAWYAALAACIAPIARRRCHSRTDVDDICQDIVARLSLSADHRLLAYRPSHSPEDVGRYLRTSIKRLMPEESENRSSLNVLRRVPGDKAASILPDLVENRLNVEVAARPSRRTVKRGEKAGEPCEAGWVTPAQKRRAHHSDVGQTIAEVARDLCVPERTALKALHEVEQLRGMRAPRQGKFYRLADDWVSALRRHLEGKQRRGADGLSVNDAARFLKLAGCDEASGRVAIAARNVVLSLIYKYNAEEACGPEANPILKVRRKYRIHRAALAWMQRRV